MNRHEVAVAADRRMLKAAVSNFEPSDLAVVLADALLGRFGYSRAEMILDAAKKELTK